MILGMKSKRVVMDLVEMLERTNNNHDKLFEASQKIIQDMQRAHTEEVVKLMEEIESLKHQLRERG